MKRNIGIIALLVILLLVLGMCAAQAAEYHVSGNVSLANIPSHAGVILDGDTTLNVSNGSSIGGISINNLAYIRGPYTLTIEGGGYPFGIRNDVDGDPAIDVESLIIDNYGTVISALNGDAIHADYVNLSAKRCTIYAPHGTGISCGGNVYIDEGDTSINAYYEAISASGELEVQGIDSNCSNVYCRSERSDYSTIVAYGKIKLWADIKIKMPIGGKIDATFNDVFLTSAGKTTNVVQLSGSTTPAVYSFMFNRNGLGSSNPMSQVVWRNGYAAEPETLTAEGFVMTGWSQNSSNTLEYRFLNNVTKSTTVYASWKEVGEGSFGGNVTWRYDGGYLYVEGEGPMNRSDPKFTDIPANLRSKITYVSVAHGVTTIETSVFKDCTALTTVQLCKTLNLIGDRAFQGCTSLTTVYNPMSNCHFGFASFYKCSSLGIMRFHDGDEIEGHAFEATALWLVQLGDYMELEEDAFCGLDTLKLVLLPEYITPNDDSVMHKWAFYGCHYLKFIVRPDSPNALAYAQRAWSGDDYAIAQVLILPNNTKKLESEAFANLTQPLIIRIENWMMDMATDAFKNSPNVILDLSYSGGSIPNACIPNKVVNVIEYY